MVEVEVEVLTLALVAMAEPAVVQVRLAVLVVDFRLAVVGARERRQGRASPSRTPLSHPRPRSQLPRWGVLALRRRWC